jgi:DNA-binding LacI/PurR family transcriptional regulator
VLQATYADRKRCRALSSSGRIDGLLVDVMVPDEVLEELVGAMSGPIVVIGRSTEVPGVAWVKADEEAGAAAATRHLTERGHKAIGLLTVRSESHPIVRERESGFARALVDAGWPATGQRWFGDWTFESGYLVGQELMTSEHRPTALFALSEVMAVGCQQAVQASGHGVPDDLAIVTVGGSRWVDYVRPALTAVHVPMYRMARRATEMLLAAIDGTDGAGNETLATEFVVRASSG